MEKIVILLIGYLMTLIFDEANSKLQENNCALYARRSYPSSPYDVVQWQVIGYPFLSIPRFTST